MPDLAFVGTIFKMCGILPASKNIESGTKEGAVEMISV
jgi:hypothetical protein